MPAPRRAVGAVDRPNADLAGIDLEMFGAGVGFMAELEHQRHHRSSDEDRLAGGPRV
jgi:hypothetical protein